MKPKFKVGDWVQRVIYAEKSDKTDAEENPKLYYRKGEYFQIFDVAENPTIYFGSKSSGCYERELKLAPKLFQALK
jgi:hypothetical protein